MTEADLASTVLILEVDILIRHSLAEYLRQCGYRVIEAANAVEAREVLEARSASVDVLFASVGGDEDGVFALASWARRAFPGLEVVRAGAVKAAADKAGDLCENGPALTKPYDHQLLHDRIRRLIAARSRVRD